MLFFLQKLSIPVVSRMRKRLCRYLTDIVIVVLTQTAQRRDLFTEQVVKNRLQARYSVYCINKNRSTRVMVRRKLSLDKIQVRSGLREDIGSLLIKPVQRLLK